jgi:hypothetical protein
MPSCEFDEVSKEFLSKALSPSRCSDGDEMHVANGFGLRHKAE